MNRYNIYCDESCHLERDHINVMVLGAVWCLEDKAKEVFKGLREIKKNHGLSTNFELKWSKVSVAKYSYYLEVLDYFFDNNDLHFRALLVPDKSKLHHKKHHQTHDEWYYKMYFDMLKILIGPRDKYNVYLDYKDTHGSHKIRKLHEVLSNANYDFSREIINRLQLVRSHEVELIQLTDFLIGIIAYVNRGLTTNQAKLKLTERMIERSGYSLKNSTLYKEDKVNIFKWHSSGVY